MAFIYSKRKQFPPFVSNPRTEPEQEVLLIKSSIKDFFLLTIHQTQNDIKGQTKNKLYPTFTAFQYLALPEAYMSMTKSYKNNPV